MPNQISVPFKRTYEIELRQAVREYILKKYSDRHPDAFRWDIGRWEALRKDGVGGVVHVDKVKSSLTYHAQLVFILTKLPADIVLEIPYAPAFNPSALPITLPSLLYERGAVLFNLAALYSQLAASEDRSTARGLKQAISYQQNAAGALKYLSSAVTPQLGASVDPDDMPLELTVSFTSSLEYLMLAQAQECVWQRAVMDSYKNGLIAKLASKVASLYATSLSEIKAAIPPIRHVFPSYWMAHLETKQHHFEAAAQYRKSLDDLEANKYGHEVSRLTQAQLLAKRGYDLARRGGVAQAVLEDIKSLLDNVQKSLARAERDNDLIYHQEVPPASALPAIQEVSMVKSIIDPGLADPKTAIGNDAVIFGDLLGWGAKTAIDIYVDRRQNWLKEEVFDWAQQLDTAAQRTLETLNLPAALEALERPIGLPPSLLKKAEEVRLDSGPDRIETSISNVQKLAQYNVEILNEALDILDQEAEEDETFRNTGRLPSHEANVELTGKAERYRRILEQASQSDEHVRQKWDEWEANITELTWDATQLEASVPSSAVSFAGGAPRAGVSPTQMHARALRVLLESLDDAGRARAELVRRAARLAESENIAPRISKAAAAIERWVEVQPSMFEDVLEGELAKYHKFRGEIEEDERRQQTLLDTIKERNKLFLQSRRDDLTVKEREHALQSLDLAYHKYKEIIRNLDEGLKFYNDFSALLSQFRDACKDWANMRRQEAQALTRSMESLSLQARSASPSPQHSPVHQAGDVKFSEPPRSSRPIVDLPPPDSDEWETMELPPAPSPVKGSLSRPSKRMR
ncbi:BRO1-domain-containing protein [Wolfiporia cocos MD-104 SS10]|uniref:BRO1-domain-containing protein n=1 Tax=Wolfiporia cocos (strain MD-104) TaxID=742152 RepID=A0A2H3JQI4_WOLCO|nr:BRO1-domain-containing protein [Wolfiporia cocos MD-104 SS10]